MTDLHTRTAAQNPRIDQGRVIVELTSRLVSAEALMASLQNAQLSSSQLLGSEHRVDLVKRLTGKSSLDSAISSTGEMITQLRQAVSTARSFKRVDTSMFTPVGAKS